MNELDHASLEASKKLVDSGIVLETDYYWATYSESTLQSIRDAGKAYPRPYLVTKESIHEKHRTGHGYYPAPCFTEVWWELPGGTVCKKQPDGITKAYTDEPFSNLKVMFNTNPTDALIELKIWLEKEKGK
jgi:hypothetical protein